jgi:hypothetical protein
MIQRYFFIEPSFLDPDTFCNVTVGSGRVRANIQIYVNEAMIADVVWALTTSELRQEHPRPAETDNILFGLHISVFPAEEGFRYIRFRIYQVILDDGAPFVADIRFAFSHNEAIEMARDLQAWLDRKEDYVFIWKD